MNLELMAMRWLQIEKRCHYVLRERSTREWSCGRPDVLGVTAARYLIEIEIKRTLSDFRADKNKRHRVNREHYLAKQPKQFYYLMPRLLADKITTPEWAGLMTPNEGGYDLMVVKTAPVNKDSQRLSLKECVHLSRLITNHMIASEERLECRHRNLIEGDVWPYWYHRPSYSDFQI